MEFSSMQKISINALLPTAISGISYGADSLFNLCSSNPFTSKCSVFFP